MPEISIVIPVYKVEKYLPACLNSLIRQTFQDFEVICVDDGSPDDSGKILDEFAKKDSRIHVIHQANAGAGVARNRGLDAATGKYLMFVDSDDWLEPNMCEVLHDLIIEKNVDMAMCNPFMELDRVKLPLIGLATIGTIPGGLYRDISHFFPTSSGLVWNKIFKMDLVRKYNIRFSERKGEDLVFGRHYLFVSNSFYCLNKNLYHYIVHYGSYSNGTTGMAVTDILEDYTLSYDFLVKHNLLEKYRKLLIYTFIGQARKAMMICGKTEPEKILNAMRVFINHVNFDDWGNSYTNKMIAAIREGRDKEGLRRLYWWLYVCPAYGFEYFLLIVYRLFWVSTTRKEYKPPEDI